MRENINPEYTHRLNLCRQILNASDERDDMSRSVELAKFTAKIFLTILELSKRDEGRVLSSVEELIGKVKKVLEDLDDGLIQSGLGKLEVAIHGNIRGEKTFSNLLPYFPSPPRY